MTKEFDKNYYYLLMKFLNQKGNEWFKEDLLSKFTNTSTINSDVIDEIYEYCLRKIMYEHAEKFYMDFKLENIKLKLVEDFVRMEKFRRENNFEDFCLAAYQQLESIVSELTTNPNFLIYFQENYKLPGFIKL